MNRLFVAGDSFASLVKNQEDGKTWTEMLAKELNLELVNIARPGASNLFICFQLDYIVDQVKENDVVIVYLTDNSRDVLPNLDLDYPKNASSILECFDSSAYLKKTKNILYKDQSLGKGKYLSTIMNFSPAWKRIASPIILEDWSDYYKKFYDPYLAFKKDIFMISGQIAKLSKQTEKFIICSGGLGENLDLDFYIYNIDKNLPIFDKQVNEKILGIDKKNYINVSSRALENRSGKVEYVNHLDDFCHLYLFKKILKKIQDDLLILSL